MVVPLWLISTNLKEEIKLIRGKSLHHKFSKTRKKVIDTRVQEFYQTIDVKKEKKNQLF